jgi:hypothetical protein
MGFQDRCAPPAVYRNAIDPFARTPRVGDDASAELCRRSQSPAANYAMSDVGLSTQTAQERFLYACEQDLEKERNHPSDDLEFARGAMIAGTIGVAMWAVIFFIVTRVFS